MTDRKKRQYLTPAQKKAKALELIEEVNRNQRTKAIVLASNAHGWTERAIELLIKALGAKQVADAIAAAEDDPDFWVKAGEENNDNPKVTPMMPIMIEKETFNSLIDLLVNTALIVEEDES